MRVLTVVGLALLSGATALAAQHSHQLEFGGFGTYTHYDPMWNLKDGIGYGGRLGFFLNDYFGLEFSGSQTTGKPKAGGATTPIRVGDASLIINSGGEHNILYVRGGYTRLSMGSVAPYNFGFNAVHGGIGDRIFFGNNVALRLEAGVYYDLTTQPGIPTRPLNYVGTAGLSFAIGGGGGRGGHTETVELPKEKRDSIIAAGGTVPKAEKPSKQRFVETGANWAHQWFWGGQAGVMIFKTAFDGFSAEPTFGGHWLITGKNTALYVGYEQAFFLSDRHATIIEPNGTIEDGNVSFKSLRRIMAGLVAFPIQKALEPYAGGGFAIMQVLNPSTTCTNCTLSDAEILSSEAQNAATKAFFWLMGGIEVRQGRLALYGHYILTSAPAGFLITGNTHTVQGGLRYSFGTSKEDVTEQH